ncbi:MULTISPECIES: 50S ribosomal protein L10 [unclassified Methanoregula]|uniref:50S ribosomal protein L10 n=1 Tax=unclassified Methanoregula TaxID=2649730 RepID=UPI0009C5190F|nr:MULTISPECIES: 50S ribosomal protein L10 [unclassified Methanoregula]OPX64090.1 MAG: 50S ribosomal protein L10 [Methanoregula sp. PtaB.Bin085]OPY34790.1 MAG: 50S ribosomal protein L10 [Methanoregula sp. PtaU1.Bin006]
MALYTHHLPAWKKDEVEDIKKNAKLYKLVGLVDMYGIPAQQVQQIRRNLRGKAVIKVTRNTLIKHAFEEIGGDLKNLSKYISGHSAIIFTNDNPFKLFKQLEKTKTKMAAKPGEKAPEDIVIPGGPTSFKPGPIVGELQQAGIPAAIEGGKVKIRETKTVVKKGGVINAKLAAILVKLDVKPMDVGVALQAAFHDGSIYEPSVLAVDETVILGQIALAARQAQALSVEAAYPTKDTMAAILTKAVRDARAVAIDAAVYEKDVVDAIIGKAQRESQALRNLVK